MVRVCVCGAKNREYNLGLRRVGLSTFWLQRAVIMICCSLQMAAVHYLLYATHVEIQITGMILGNKNKNYNEMTKW